MTIFMHRGQSTTGPRYHSRFVAKWDTTQPGSANDTVVLPLVADGTYDFYIDWGDGSRDTISGYDQSEVTHQYNDTGIYTIQLVANNMIGWQFNDSGDDDKLVEIMDWGPLRFVSDDTNLFKGCSNLTLSTTSNPPFNADVSGMFQDCSSLTGTGGNIMYWDMSSVTGMNFMLAGCTNLDADLSNWDVSSIKNAEGFMAGAGLSTMNYDRILSGWSSQPVQSGVTISFGDTKYSAQSGELYRNALLSSGWVITDGGRPPIGFISTWNTTITGGNNYPNNTPPSPTDTVVLPLWSNGVYDFGVDWGDGSQDQITSYNQSEVTHQYSSTGIYTISITGGITGWQFGGGGDDDKITNISQWGPLTINNDVAFYGCTGLEVSTTDSLKFIDSPLPVTSFYINKVLFNFFKVGNASNTGTSSMTGCDASVWDVSDMTYMRGFLGWCGVNSDLGSWDVSNVTEMGLMFSSASFDNGGSPSISGWDVSNVTGMNSMFATHYSTQPTGFNQPIGSWDVGNVSQFQQMFGTNAWFDQDLGAWDMSSAYDIDFMFGGYPNVQCIFNNGGSDSIKNWNFTSNMQRMPMVFHNNIRFNQPIGSWDTSNVYHFGGMFKHASGFDQDLGSWNVTSATYMVDFMLGVTLSTANYDSLLNGWGPQNVNNNINVNFGNSRYSSSSSYWRNHLVNSHGWTITDGGQA